MRAKEEAEKYRPLVKVISEHYVTSFFSHNDVYADQESCNNNQSYMY